MKVSSQYRQGEAGRPSSRMDAANVETDWHSILSSETDLPPDVFSVVKEEEVESTESRWGARGAGTHVNLQCKEQREESESGMGKLPYIPTRSLQS